MNIKRYLLTLLLLIAIFICPVAAMASDITDADYYGVITITNDDTANTTGVSCNISTANLSNTLIDGNYSDSAFTRVAMRNSAGADVPFMPGYDESPWMIWVPSIGEDANLNYILYTGNASLSSTKYYFPDTNMITPDSVSLEGSANFSHEYSGYINTSAVGTIFVKTGAISCNVTATGNVTGILVPIIIENADAELPAGWVNGGRSDTQAYEGTYSWKATAGTTCTQALTWNNIFQGENITFEMQAYAGGAGCVLNIDDGVGTTSSAAHSGGSSWELLTVTREIDGSATKLELELDNSGAGSVYYDLAAIAGDGVGGLRVVNTPVLSSGEYKIELYADGTNLHIEVDDSLEDSTPLNGISMPNNSNSWIDGSENTTYYIEYVKRYVGGNLVQDVAWEYDTTFTDLSGNGNDATPSFRTASSDTDVSASLTEFIPISTAIPPGYTISDPDPFITSNITTSGNFTTGSVPAGGPPGAAVVDEAATAGGTPNIWLWGILGGFTVAMAGLFISWMEKRYGGGGGTLLLRIGVGFVIFGLLVAFQKFDFWMLIMYVIIAIATAMMSRQIEWGGNVNQLNIIGFLAMSWIGLTIVGRIMEGQLLTGAETTWANYYAFTQEFKLFNLFSLPVLNLQFWTHGIPSLIKWDYSVFGGNAQLFQYLLYSLTAVVGLIIFSVIIGLLFSSFNRLR